MNAVKLVHHQGEQRVDSRVIAEQLGVQHKNTITLIEKHAKHFERFGLLPFQTEAVKVAGARGAKHHRFALLNEDQAYFLLSLTKNTTHVVELKVRLVMAFREARYGNACQVLAARKEEASKSGRRLAHWRYDKLGVHQHVANLREQLKLPIDLDGLAYDQQ
ncbi:Rha family transcriptional regulator [Stutzerimonas sp. NM35]